MKVLLLFLIVACLALVGCPSYSVHPLYTDQDAVVEPALEGTWGTPRPSDKEVIIFRKSDDHAYSLSVFHPDTKVKENYVVHLVRLEDQMYTWEDDAIRKQSNGVAGLEYQMAEGGVLVTAPTEAVRRYISAHTQDAFTPVQYLKRRGKATIQP
jgi:hypothetical protein